MNESGSNSARMIIFRLNPAFSLSQSYSISLAHEYRRKTIVYKHRTNKPDKTTIGRQVGYTEQKGQNKGHPHKICRYVQCG